MTHYDYGFRIYNPSIARFLSVDPLTPEYPELTPYQFASNTPIQAIDLDGLEAKNVNEDSYENQNWFVKGWVGLFSHFLNYQDYNSRNGGLIGKITQTYEYKQGDEVYETYDLLNLTVGTYLIAGIGKTPSKSGNFVKSKPTQSYKPFQMVLKTDDVVQGIVKSRINIANGRTRFTPLRPRSGEPVSAGFDHVVKGHFDKPIAKNRSIFTISEDGLKQVLQSKKVVNSPVKAIDGGQFVRTVDVGFDIGISSVNQGGKPTSYLQVITDKAGNLITTYPVGRN